MPRHDAAKGDFIYDNVMPHYTAVIGAAKNGTDYIVEDHKGNRMMRPTDDYGAAVNAILAKYSGTNQAGPLIKTKSGTFNQYTGIVNTKTGWTLEGAGKNVTNIRAQAAITQFSSSNTFKSVTIKNLDFVGNSVGVTAVHWNALNAPNAEGYLTMENVHSYGFTGTVYNILSSSINRFANVSGYSADKGMVLTSCAHNWLEGCDFEDTASYGLEQSDTEETYISNQKLDLNVGTAYYASFQDEDIYISNMRILNARANAFVVAGSFVGPMMISNLTIENPSAAGAGSDGIVVGAGAGQVLGTNINIQSSNSNMRYGINDLGNGNIWSGSIANAQTAPFNFAGTGTKVNITGVVTSAKGTGSIASGATTAVITHGLSFTPVASEINISFTENPSNTPRFMWISTITSTQFTVNVDSDPGASNLDFGWSAMRI